MGEGRDAHEVQLDAFEIGRYPVTVEEYSRFVEESGLEPKEWDTQIQYPNRPVVYVSWHNAKAYCDWLGARLPTEAQWERAARGAEGRSYPWGEKEPDEQHANYDQTAVRAPTPVGLFPMGATDDGICDLAGNVWEWTVDWYGTYPTRLQRNPTGANEGQFKVLRGGAWYYDEGYLRSAYRNANAPEDSSGVTGFRCARNLPQSASPAE